MGAKTLIRPATKLYDEDFVEWAFETTRLLRARQFEELDVEHLAEEIEDMAKRDKREMSSRLRVLIKHLLKWQHQAGKRSGSWQSTIITQRAAIEQVLEQSPSLRRMVPASVARVYRDAAQAAAAETGLPAESFPRDCPFSAEQILDRTFLPGR